MVEEAVSSSKKANAGVETISDEQILFRLPRTHADKLRARMASGAVWKNSEMELTLDKGIEYRDGTLELFGTTLLARRMSLPTITESHITNDKIHLTKTADISEMIICRPTTKPFPTALTIDDYLHPHGIVPPLKNCRKRRFRRPEIIKKYMDSKTVMREISRLLDADEEADHIYFDKDDPDAIRHNSCGLGGFTVEADYVVPKAPEKRAVERDPPGSVYYYAESDSEDYNGGTESDEEQDVVKVARNKDNMAKLNTSDIVNQKRSSRWQARKDALREAQKKAVNVQKAAQAAQALIKSEDDQGRGLMNLRTRSTPTIDSLLSDESGNDSLGGAQTGRPPTRISLKLNDRPITTQRSTSRSATPESVTSDKPRMDKKSKKKRDASGSSKNTSPTPDMVQKPKLKLTLKLKAG